MSGCDFSASMQEPETDGSSYYRVGFVFEDRMLRLMGAVEIGDLAGLLCHGFLVVVAMDDGAPANAPQALTKYLLQP
jgi:hypothetical protein